MSFSRRYQPPSGSEAEIQPGSRGRILRNKLEITRKCDMDRAEYEALLREQERYLSLIGPDTRFTAELLRQMHRDWLGEIYAWAGEYRTVNLTKGSFTWPAAVRVPDNMAAFESGLLRENTPCPPGPLEDVARRIAVVHAELLLIHPFRDGNGRISRWLADLMAAQAGHAVPHYKFTGRGSGALRARYLVAVQGGYLQDYAALTGFFLRALRRGLEEES